MDDEKEPIRKRPEDIPTNSLIKEINSHVQLLIKKEIQLVKEELKADIKSEIFMIVSFGIAIIALLIALVMIIMAGVFALATVMPGWGAALIAFGVMILIAATAAIVGWKKRVRSPFPRTIRTLRDDLPFTKEKFA